MFNSFYPTALATAYGLRPKFVRAEHSATADGENCAYGPTLNFLNLLQKLGHKTGEKAMGNLKEFLENTYVEKTETFWFKFLESLKISCRFLIGIENI